MMSKKIKLIYLHQYFKTNSSSGGSRSYEFSEHLSKNDVEVNVITGAFCESDPTHIGDNIYIHQTRTQYSNLMSSWKRMYAFVHYLVKSFFIGMKIKNIDIVFATSTPLTIGLPAVFLKKIKKAKLIFEVRDVWPDIPIELGYIKNRFVIILLKWYEMWIYKNSDHIIVLSEGMFANLKKKGVSPDKMTIIENTAILYLYDQLQNVSKPDEYRDKFVCIHPGTMGHVNGLDFILDTAKNALKKDKDILFLLIGKGKMKEKLVDRVVKEEITNVIFKDALPKNEIVKSIKSSDIGIMCVDNRYKILEDNSANKFFDFLGAGLPVLINYAGWQKEAIETNECGYSCLTPEQMAESVIKLKKDKMLLSNMKVNSRKLAESKYSDIKAKAKLLNIFKRVCE